MAGSGSDWSWWRHGVVYQIYPRSYMDASGDGVGDLEGIRRRLGHLEWLGVDAVWLSPCFRSPMADFGYDVSDYTDVDPLFGTLEDMDRLLEDAHARGIRILLDWVPGHTSDQHPWFLESRASRESPKRDWYLWRDPKPDGGPPNNWMSAFGGPAWTFDERTGQYYMHSHLKEQPDLNWRNPEVVSAMHDVLRFWLDRGVDGFRIDVIHRILKDPELRDNPEIPGGPPGYGGQRHVHDQDHPDVHDALRGIRRVLDEYTPERMAVGEVFIMDPEVAASYLGRGDELHLAFNFSLMRAPWDAARFREEVEAFERALPPDGWPDVVLSSHDAPRHATRFDHPEQGERRARTAALLLLTLRGTPFLYYGEELGLRAVAIPEERIRDPIAWTLHPKLTRDPSRTPMPWRAGRGAGFTEAEPWLPLNPDHETRNVAALREDPASILHLYRELLALRRAHRALHAGDYRRLPAPEGVYAWERRAEGSRALCAASFSDAPRRVELGAGAVRGGLRTEPGAALPRSAGAVELAPNEGVVLLVG